MAEGKKIKGASAAQVKAQAEAALARAEVIAATVEGEATAATAETKRATAHIEDAERRLRELEDELVKAEAAKKKLTTSQRKVMDLLARGEQPGSTVQKTIGALNRRGYLDYTPDGLRLSEKGRGVHDPSLVGGDIEKQMGYIERLRAEAARDVQTAVRSETKAAESVAAAAKKRKGGWTRAEAMRDAGAGQYDQPIGPQRETPETTAPARRKALEAERRKVARRLKSAEDRLFVNDQSTPANQDRTSATYEKHKAHLQRIDAAIDKTYRDENEGQAKREADFYKANPRSAPGQRIGARTPKQEEARERRLEREARVARFKQVKAMREAGAGQYEQPIGPAPAPTPRLPKGYKIVKSEDPAAKHELHGPGGRLVSVGDNRAELVSIARGDVAELKAAAAVEKAEERKTTAVEKGTKKRAKARNQEGQAAAGNTAEFARKIAENADLLASELSPEQRAGVDAQMQKTEPARQKKAKKNLEKAAKAVKDTPPPPPPPTPPPAPPGPPDDPNERRRLLQQLRDALAKRAAQQEQLARVEAEELRARKVANEVARRRQQAEIRAAASAQLASEKVAARVGPEHEETRQRVQQDRLDRRLNRARERQVRAVEAATVAEVNARQVQAQRLTDLLAQHRVERQAQARAVGAGQYENPIGPRRPTGAEAAQAAGTDQYDTPIGPRKPTREEKGNVKREQRRREARETQASDNAAKMTEAIRLSDEYTAAQARLGSQLEKTAISADLASQRFRKHGALTTEFIEAAAKGEVTVGELGYQLTATIGKFAGWTAAASAVYGVVGAMSQVAEGAIAASSAVGLIGRVVTQDLNPDKLQGGLIDFSEKFNLSIQDVADAVYGAGKSFHDLPGAMKGAESGLFAMKVGELDAGAATQSLTAIVNGFKLSASGLEPVMDTVNNVTNKFGGNVGQLVQGVAKAGGQFLAAGGNYRELVAILNTGARLTGATAEEVATAVGRSASVLRTPAGAARARAAGLDPTLDPLAVLQQAQGLACGASPERVQELARALVPAGGQFARIFVPLIQNAERLNEVLAETTPEKTKNSAQKELAKVLGQANEEISKVANGLQRLGVALASAGLLDPVLLFVKGINVAINAVTDLVRLFGKIPDPFDGILATALELYGVLRLLRRFDIGGQLPAGTRAEPLRQFLGAGPERTSKRQVLQGVAAERRFLLDTRERVGQQAALAAFRRQEAASRLAEAIQSGDADRVERRTATLLKLSENADDLAEEEADLRRLINDNDRRRVDTLKNIRSGVAPEQALAASGGNFRTADVARPTTQGPERVSGGGVILPGGGGRRVASGAQVAALAREEAELASRTERFAAQAGRLGTTGRIVGATAVGAANATKAASVAVRGAGAGLRSLALGLGSMLGPLDFIILGVLGAVEVANQFQKNNERHAARLAEAQRPSSDPDELQRRLEKLPNGPGPPAPGTMRFGNDVPDDVKLRRRLEAEQAALVAQQQAGRALGTGVVEQRLATEKAIAATPKEQVAALQRALAALDQGYAALYGARDLERAKKSGDKDAIAAAQAVIDRAATAKATILSGLNALATAGSAVEQALAAAKDFKALGDFIDKQGASFELAGGRGPAGAALGAAAVRASQLYAETDDTVAFLKSLKDAEQAVVAAAETRLKRTLDAARSPRQRRAARRTYLTTIREDLGIDQVGDRLDLIAEQQQSRKQRINTLKLKRQLNAGGPAIDPLTGQPKLGGLPSSGLSPEEEAKLRALTQDSATATKEERRLRQALRHKKELLSDAERELKRAAFEEALALYEANTSVGAARAPAGAARIAYQLRRIGIELKRAIKEYGRNSKEVLGIIGEQLSLQSQAVDQELAAIEAAGELAAAKAGSPAAEQAARAKALQEKLDFQKAHPERYDPKVDVVQTQAQILENAKTKKDSVEQEYRELLDARYAYLASLTDDPVKLAKLQEQQANELLARGGLSQKERYRALADRNNARRARENAINARRVDELDLRHDIGRLSDEQYLSGLEKLWRGMKKGTEAWREMRARILRFKHDMNEGSEGFSLDVGNIRLPTVYEVNRAIREGKDVRQRTVVNNSPTVNINLAPGDDGTAVVRTLDGYLGTSARSALRASADIGI